MSRKISMGVIKIFLYLSTCCVWWHNPALAEHKLSLPVRRVHARSVARVTPTLDSDTHVSEWERKLSSRGGQIDNNLSNAIAGSIAFAVLEKIVAKGMTKAGIKYPPMLAGCIILFAFLFLSDLFNPRMAAVVMEALTPAAAFLAKWMPPFFIPGLVVLPLSPSVGGTAEVLKVVVTAVVGFVITLLSTAYSVTLLRKATGAVVFPTTNTSTKAPIGPRPKPYSDASWNFFWRGAAILGFTSVIATRSDNPLSVPIQSAFLTFLTMAAFVWSARLPASYIKAVHPLATSSVAILLIIQILAKITGRDFTAVLRSYRVASLNPMKAGAGDYLLYLLGPSVIAFAVPMYGRYTLIKRNLPAVVTSTLVSTIGSFFVTALFVRWIALGSGPNANVVRLSVIARNVTTALAMIITDMLGGDMAIAASVVCLTGILGGTYGKMFLNAVGIVDPIARGLSMGASALGLGVAAVSDEPDAFPFAAIAMVLTAVVGTSLVTIPAVKDSLVHTTVGDMASAARGVGSNS